MMFKLDWLALRLRADCSVQDARALDAFAAQSNGGTDGPFSGGLLRSLSPALQSAIGAEVVEALNERDRVGRTMTDDEVYLFVLESFGLDCPHSKRAPFVHYGRVVPDATQCPTCGSIFVKPPDSFLPANT